MYMLQVAQLFSKTLGGLSYNSRVRFLMRQLLRKNLLQVTLIVV